jgi:molecular chaperone DnaJ
VKSPNPYRVLGVSESATTAEIKAAYRALVKKHHPDLKANLSQDSNQIVAINAAWELLRYQESRVRYDNSSTSQRRTAVRANANSSTDAALERWLREVYGPIDLLLAQVIEPLSAELSALSADPYDDQLMENFCAYLERSRKKLERVEKLFRSLACPSIAKSFGLSLYHCLSGVQDAIAEFERYTAGYVDDYLRDGREMIREASHRRSRLQAQLPG